MGDIQKRCIVVVAAIWIVWFTACTTGFAFDYFDTPINYWSKEHSAKEKVKRPHTHAKKKSESFNWATHMDPNNDDFFREGDYLPPKAFMEVSRRPTDRNIELWFKYIEKKNALHEQLQQNIEAFVRKTSLKESTKETLILEAVNKIVAKASKIDPRRFRLRFYFDINCPHCKKMIKEIVTVYNMGIHVEGIRVDQQSGHLGLPFAVRRSKPEELKKNNIKSVPFVIVADMDKKRLLRFSGFQTSSELVANITR